MKAAGLVALLILGAVVLPLALGTSPHLRALVTETLGGGGLPAPPTVRLATPQDGDGVSPIVSLVGEARSEGARIADVQYRIDGSRWRSIPDAPRGHALSSFRVELALEPGARLLEVRAGDGDAWSLPARASVRVGDAGPAPTIRVLSPRDGDGLPAGEVEVLGTVSGQGPFLVMVRNGAALHEARIQETPSGASWRALVPLAEGDARLVVTASTQAGDAVAREVALRVGDPPPPTLTLLRPEGAASFGSSRPHARFAGIAAGAEGVARVTAQLDEGDPMDAELLVDGPAAAWSWSVDVRGLASGEHRARFIAHSPTGATSAPREVAFAVRSPYTLAITGDDAPRPTLTPLQFRLVGGGEARWTLDGEPIGEGNVAHVNLTRPGDHVLVARAAGEDGDVRAARLPLFAQNRAPRVAALVADDAVAASGTTFTAHASDPDGVVTRLLFEFGDGATAWSTDPVVRHAYGRQGAYTARVTAFDDDGGSSAPYAATVGVANADPLAGFSWSPLAPKAGEDVVFEDASLDPEGRLASWAWDFGGASAHGRQATHAFPTRGPHVVSLRVEDVDGGVSTRSAIVEVANQPPLVDARIEPRLPSTLQEVLFTDASTKVDGLVTGWTWSFGDGDLAEGRSARHAYAAPGTYEVTLAVEDDWGAVATRTFNVSVLDAAPLVESIRVEPESPRAMQDVRFAAVARDVEGAVQRIVWDFGDNATAEGPEATHRYARQGAYEVTVAAYDGKGGRGVLALRLVVLPSPPTAVLHMVDGGFAGYPTLLEASASDADGLVVDHAFDMDGDGVPECSGPARRCAWTFAAPGFHVARLRVTDDEGNVGEAALPLDILPAPGGLSAPTVRVDAPAPGATLKGQLLVHGRAAGSANVTQVDVQLRDAAWTLGTARGGWLAADGTASWSLLLDTRVVPDGAYLLAVRATDAVGGVNETLVPVVLENGPRESELTLRVTNLPSGALVDAPLTVRGSAFHPAGGVTIRYRIDDGPWQTAEGTLLSWGIALSPTDLAPGPHVLRVEAHRGLLERASADIPFRVADLRPVLSIEQPPGPTLYARLRIEGTHSPGSRVLWRFDTGLWKDAPSEGGRFLVDDATEGLASGPHLVTVKAIHDATGLQGEPLSFSVRVLNPKVHDAAIQQAAPERADVPWGAALAVVALALAGFGAPRRRL